MTRWNITKKGLVRNGRLVPFNPPLKRKPRAQPSRRVRKKISVEDRAANRAANRALVKAAEFYFTGAVCHMISSWSPRSDQPFRFWDAFLSFLKPKESK